MNSLAKTPRVFISAGEASGDFYASLVMDALGARVRGVEFFGCGGDHMRAAGLETVVDAHQISMVGLVEVLPGLARAWKALRNLKAKVDAGRPDLAVLVDFPDFNLRLARHLKRRGVPVLYFIAPQAWAWRRGRLRNIRQTVSKLACIFPFEEAFFRQAGIDAEFVGHPLAGRVAPRRTAEEFRREAGLIDKGPLIALLPGSRKKEIELNLPPMLEAAGRLAAEQKCSFVMPAASTIGGEWLRQRASLNGLPLRVVENATYDAVAHSQAAIVASGTATVETALLGTPMVIVYRVSGASWLLGRWLVHTPYYSMVNLVAGRRVAPEFIQGNYHPEAVAGAVTELLNYPAVREKMQRELREICDRLSARSTRPGAGFREAQGETSDPIQRVAAMAESMLVEP